LAADSTLRMLPIHCFRSSPTSRKAGILRSQGTLITLPQHPEVNDAIGEAVRELGAQVVNATTYVPPITPASESFSDQSSETPRNRYPLEVLGRQIEVNSPLAGRHQLRNVALAIAAAAELKQKFGYEISSEDIARGIANTRWSGRFQVFPSLPEIVLDVAHNPAGAWALRSALSSRYDGQPLTIIFGAMRDKAIAEIAEILFPLSEEVIAVKVNSPRAASGEEIREISGHVGTPVVIASDLPAALDLARERGRTIVITGSVYLVGAALERLSL
jgi:dihydrofolate synthase/folylpolyglutamate synthase